MEEKREKGKGITSENDARERTPYTLSKFFCLPMRIFALENSGKREASCFCALLGDGAVLRLRGASSVCFAPCQTTPRGWRWRRRWGGAHRGERWWSPAWRRRRSAAAAAADVSRTMRKERRRGKPPLGNAGERRRLPYSFAATGKKFVACFSPTPLSTLTIARTGTPSLLCACACACACACVCW